jgi:hypothetical protein
MNRLGQDQHGEQRLRSSFRTVTFVIGCAVVTSQPASAQAASVDATEAMGAADAKDDFLAARFRPMFLGRASDPVAGWNLAASLGPAASPVLWRLLEGLAAGESRFALLAAIQAAGGAGEDDRMLRWIDAPGRSARDRMFVAYLLAAGPERAQARADLYARLRGPNDMAELLARLAAARFPGVEGLPAVLADGDQGLAAAALFAGSAVREFPPRGTRHETLFWRGALLGAARQRQGGELRERALALRQERSEGFAGVRQAANWLLAGLAEPALTNARPDDETLAILVGDPGMRTRSASALATSRSLRAEPEPAMAVAHVLVSEIDEAIASCAAWAAAPSARSACFALAFRLLVDGKSGAVPSLPGAPAWAVVRAASGAAVAGFADVGDEAVARAAAAFTAGRLPAAAFADTLELAVWRAGAHPGLVPRRLERDFVRDLVLAGSQEGGGRYQPHVPPAQRYVCAGLGREEPWFHVAIAFHEWSATPRGAIPAAARWPR